MLICRPRSVARLSSAVVVEAPVVVLASRPRSPITVQCSAAFATQPGYDASTAERYQVDLGGNAGLDPDRGARRYGQPVPPPRLPVKREGGVGLGGMVVRADLYGYV